MEEGGRGAALKIRTCLPARSSATALKSTVTGPGHKLLSK